MKKKMATYALTGALTLGAAGGIALPAFASTDTTETTTSTDTTESSELSFERWGGDELDEATKEKIQSIMDQMKAELAEIDVTLPERPDHSEKENPFADLDEEIKAQAEEIISQLKEGTLTKEEVQTQLEALGVTLPERPDHSEKENPFADLDEETQTQTEEIISQLKDGTLTKEEARTQLEALGVTLPERGHHGGKHDLFADLDEETQEEAESIMEEAKEQMEDLGLEMPEKGHRGGMHHGPGESGEQATPAE